MGLISGERAMDVGVSTYCFTHIR